jgi:hypothetical protein
MRRATRLSLYGIEIRSWKGLFFEDAERSRSVIMGCGGGSRDFKSSSFSAVEKRAHRRSQM